MAFLRGEREAVETTGRRHHRSMRDDYNPIRGTYTYEEEVCVCGLHAGALLARREGDERFVLASYFVYASLLFVLANFCCALLA